MKLTELPRADRLPENPGLRDLTEEVVAQWRHHPVTRCYLLFLEHLADNYRLGHLQTWEQGDLNEGTEAERRGRILCLEDLHTLTLADMQRLYGYKPDEDSQEKT